MENRNPLFGDDPLVGGVPQNFSQNSLLSPESLKQRQVANATKKKQQELQRKSIKEALQANYDAVRPRTGGEVATDVAASTLNGAIGLGATVYGGIDLASRAATFGNYSFDDDIRQDTGFGSENFDQARAFVNENFKSDPLKAATERVAQRSHEREAGAEQREAQRVEEGQGYIERTARELGGDFVAGVESYIDNPIAAADAAIESVIVQAGAAGAVGKTAVGVFGANTVKKMGADEAKKYLGSKVGKEAISKVAEKAAIGYTAAAEGLGNAVSAKGEFHEMSLEQKMDSPIFADLVNNQGMSVQEATDHTANKIFDVVAAIAGTVGAVSSKFSQAGKFEGNIFVKGSDVEKLFVSKVVGGVVGGATKEGAEEIVQGGAGEFAGNVATQTYVDPEQNLTEGVGSGAASGLVAGSLSGAGIALPSTLAKATQDSLGKLVVGKDYVHAKKAQEQVAAGNQEVLQDKTNEDYSPEVTLAAMSLPTEQPKTKEEIEPYVATMGDHVQELTQKGYELATTNERGSKKFNEGEAMLNKAAKYGEIIDRFNLSITDSKEEVDKAIDTAFTNLEETGDTATQEEVTSLRFALKNRKDAFTNKDGTIDTGKVEKAKQAYPEMSEEISLEVSEVEAKRRLEEKPQDQGRAKSLKEVNNEVIHGSNKSSKGEYQKGVLQYANNIRYAIENNNEPGAQHHLDGLATFGSKHQEKAKDFKAAADVLRNMPAKPREYTAQEQAIVNKAESYTSNSTKSGHIEVGAGFGRLAQEVVNESLYIDAAIDKASHNYNQTFDAYKVDHTTQKQPEAVVSPVGESTSTGVETEQADAVATPEGSDKPSRSTTTSQDTDTTQAQPDVVASVIDENTRKTLSNGSKKLQETLAIHDKLVEKLPTMDTEIASELLVEKEAKLADIAESGKQFQSGLAGNRLALHDMVKAEVQLLKDHIAQPTQTEAEPTGTRSDSVEVPGGSSTVVEKVESTVEGVQETEKAAPTNTKLAPTGDTNIDNASKDIEKIGITKKGILKAKGLAKYLSNSGISGLTKTTAKKFFEDNRDKIDAVIKKAYPNYITAKEEFVAKEVYRESPIVSKTEKSIEQVSFNRAIANSGGVGIEYLKTADGGGFNAAAIKKLKELYGNSFVNYAEPKRSYDQVSVALRDSGHFPDRSPTGQVVYDASDVTRQIKALLKDPDAFEANDQAAAVSYAQIAFNYNLENKTKKTATSFANVVRGVATGKGVTEKQRELFDEVLKQTNLQTEQETQEDSELTDDQIQDMLNSTTTIEQDDVQLDNGAFNLSEKAGGQGNAEVNSTDLEDDAALAEIDKKEKAQTQLETETEEEAAALAALDNHSSNVSAPTNQESTEEVGIIQDDQDPGYSDDGYAASLNEELDSNFGSTTSVDASKYDGIFSKAYREKIPNQLRAHTKDLITRFKNAAGEIVTGRTTLKDGSFKQTEVSGKEDMASAIVGVISQDYNLDIQENVDLLTSMRKKLLQYLGSINYPDAKTETGKQKILKDIVYLEQGMRDAINGVYDREILNSKDADARLAYKEGQKVAKNSKFVEDYAFTDSILKDRINDNELGKKYKATKNPKNLLHTVRDLFDRLSTALKDKLILPSQMQALESGIKDFNDQFRKDMVSVLTLSNLNHDTSDKFQMLLSDALGSNGMADVKAAQAELSAKVAALRKIEEGMEDALKSKIDKVNKGDGTFQELYNAAIDVHEDRESLKNPGPNRTYTNKEGKIVKPTKEDLRIHKIIKSIRDSINAQIDNPTAALDKAQAEVVSAQEQLNELMTDETINLILDKNLTSIMAMVSFNWLGGQAKDMLSVSDTDINLMSGNSKDSRISSYHQKYYDKVGTTRNILAETLGLEILQSLGITSTGDTTQAEMSGLQMALGTYAVMALVDSGHLLHKTRPVNDLVELKILAEGMGKPEADALREEAEINSEKTIPYVRIATQETTDSTGQTVEIPSADIQGFTDILKHDNGLLEDLFGIESKIAKPSLTLPQKVLKKIKGTIQTITPTAERIIGEHQKRPNKMKTNMMNFMKFASEPDSTTGKRRPGGHLLTMAGGNTNVVGTTHITRVASKESLNKGLQSEIDNAFEWDQEVADNSKDGFFYLLHNVWKPNRIGILNSLMNPQQSKVHRHIMTMTDTEVTIDIENSDHLSGFLAGVAQSLGVSTDKLLLEDSVQIMNRMLDPTNWSDTDPTAKQLSEAKILNEAIAHLRVIKNKGQPTGEPGAALDTIQAAVKIGGENFYSLDGLMAMAVYSEALDKGQTTFDTDLFREADGITNGVIISATQVMNSANQVMALNRGGMTHNGTANYGDWINQPGHQDTYQDLAGTWIEQLVGAVKGAIKLAQSDIGKATMSARMHSVFLNNDKKFPIGSTIKVVDAIKDIVGPMTELDEAKNEAISSFGRLLAKDPTMTTSYGAGANKIISNFIIASMQRVYDEIAKGAVDSTQLTNMNNRLSDILGKPVKITKENALKHTFNSEDTRIIMEGLRLIHGEALRSALDIKYDQFRQATKILNNSMHLNYTGFSLVYEDAIARIAKEKNRSPTEDELNALHEELRDTMPIFAGFFSESTADGVITFKQKREVQNGDPEYTSRINFRDTISNQHIITDFTDGELTEINTATDNKSVNPETGKTYREEHLGKSSNMSSMHATGSKRVWKEPGVSPMVLGVQALDAAIMLKLIEKFPALNIHDAIGIDIIQALVGAQAINEAFVEVMWEYSLHTSMSEANDRAIKAMRAYDAKHKLTGKNSLTNQLDEIMKLPSEKEAKALKVDFDPRYMGFNNGGGLGTYEAEGTGWLGSFHREATDTNARKQRWLETVTHVDQYTLGEGSAIENPYYKAQIEGISKATKDFTEVELQRYIVSGLITESKEEKQAKERKRTTKLQKKKAAKKEGTISPEPQTSRDTTARYALLARTIPEIRRNHVFKGEQAQQLDDILKHMISNRSYEQAIEAVKPDAIVVETIEQALIDNNKNLGSSANATGELLDPADFNYTQDMNEADVLKIFDDLNKMDPNNDDTAEHKSHLQDLLSNLVSKVISGTKLHVNTTGLDAQGNRVTETEGVVQNGEVFIQIAHRESKVAAGTRMSGGETLLHEMIHVILQVALDENTWAANEVRSLYDVVLKSTKKDPVTGKEVPVVTAETFLRPGVDKNAPNYADELAAAQERYDYIFGDPELLSDEYTTTHGQKVTLNYDVRYQEFAAFALTNAQFREALKEIDNNPRNEVHLKDLFHKGSFIDTLTAVIENIYNWLSETITGTKDTNAALKMQLLAEQLAGIDQKKKGALYSFYQASGNVISKTVNTAAYLVLTPIAAAVKLGTKSKYRTVKNASQVAEDLATPEVTAEALAESVSNLRRIAQRKEDGFADSFLNELKGRTKNNSYLHDLNRLSNQMIDQMRSRVTAGVASSLVKSYKNPEGVSKTEKIAITRGLLKSDVTILMDGFGKVGQKNYRAPLTLEQIAQLYKDPAHLRTKIDQLEKEIIRDNKVNKHWLIRMSASLGQFMATGIPSEEFHLMNAQNITSLVNTQLGQEGNQELNTRIVDELATLHAINKISDEVKSDLNNLFERELKADPKENGISYTLAMHRETKAKSLEKLFDGSENLMAKGYIKEIFNPAISYVIAPASSEDEMKKHNFTMGRVIRKDHKRDPNSQEMRIFINKDGLTRTYMAGIVSFTSSVAKGTNILNIHSQGGNADPAEAGYADFRVIERQKANIIKKIANNEAVKVKPGETTLIPITDTSGKTVDYRYMMDEQHKIDLLEKDDSFDKVLGGMEANIQDKVNTKEINKRVINETFADWAKKQKPGGKHPMDLHGWTAIGPNVADPKMREIYQMLPYEAREEITKVWGGDIMYVPTIDVTLIFGQRKWSIADVGKAKDNLNYQENQFIRNFAQDTLHTLVDRPTARAIENIWQEGIKMVKDAIVIKSGVVLTGNVTSNMITLKMLDVPLKYIIKDHAIALIEAKKYLKDFAEIERLERELTLVESNRNSKDINNKIKRLKGNLFRNPVRELIEEGIHQSIVEDVETTEGAHSFKGKGEKFLVDNKIANAITNATPKLLRDAIKVGTMQHDTKIYKFMRDATQLSDFAARHVLHEHNKRTKIAAYKAKHKKSPNKGEIETIKRESIDMVIDVFINYDLPTHKSIQYANDMGLIMFTKFFIRTQKVLLHIAKEHPESVIAKMAIEGAFGINPEDIYDSAMTPWEVGGKFNFNPFEVFAQIWRAPLLPGSLLP